MLHQVRSTNGRLAAGALQWWLLQLCPMGARGEERDGGDAEWQSVILCNEVRQLVIIASVTKLLLSHHQRG